MHMYVSLTWVEHVLNIEHYLCITCCIIQFPNFIGHNQNVMQNIIITGMLYSHRKLFCQSTIKISFDEVEKNFRLIFLPLFLSWYIAQVLPITFPLKWFYSDMAFSYQCIWSLYSFLLDILKWLLPILQQRNPRIIHNNLINMMLWTQCPS